MRAVVHRLCGALGLLFGLSALTFGLTFLAPGDPAMQIARQRIGRVPTVDDLERIQVAYGLDQPLPTQYLRWAVSALGGDLGYSFRTGQPVLGHVLAAAAPTMTLAIISLTLSVLIGLPIGVLAAWRPGSGFDQVARLGGMLTATTPEFLVGYGLILVFAIGLGWLPSFGMRDPLAWVLPVLTICTGTAARVAFFARSLIVREQPALYLLMARAKGAPAWRVWLGHLAPNVAGPFLVFLALQLGGLSTGLVIVETLFAWPGLGLALAQAVSFRDLPMIQALVLGFVLSFVSLNALADLGQYALDPRGRV